MLGALYIGLSGMNAYSSGLNTISNNVANLNTTGFKSTSLDFTDLYKSSDSSTRGSGVSAGQAAVQFTQGELRESENALDLAIDGRGFLVLQDGDATRYARTGQFEIDKDGYVALKDSEYRLQLLNDKGELAAAFIDDARTNPPVATQTIKFADNLSSTATEASVANIKVYDSGGVEKTWRVEFSPVGQGSPGQWNVKILNASGAEIAAPTITFNSSVIAPSSGTITITDNTNAAAPHQVTLDFSSVTSFSSGTTSTIRAASVDGTAMGNLTEVTVDEDGALKISYSNGENKIVGHIAVADIRTLEALEAGDGGLFALTGRSDITLARSNKDGAGEVKGKRQEASNVDLSQQFGELILIQRGYQASSQVVSVANEMIQQLFGIKGNG